MPEARAPVEDSEYEYVLEPVDNYRIHDGERDIRPSHQITFQRDSASKFNKERYMVDVSDDTIEFVKHRVGSSRKYNANRMFPLRYRELLVADGWEIVDGADHIGIETLNEVEAWLDEQGIDPETVDVRVNAHHVSVTFSTRRYLEDDAWDTYIGVMRAHDAITWAQKQGVHYVADEDLPALLDGGDR